MYIETDRLIISEFTMDMVSVVQENSIDEDNKKYVPDEVWETVEEVEETLEFLISQYGSFKGPLVYPVIVKETNDNIGYVQLVPLGDGRWEIGYHVAKKYTGNGYATEAVKAFLPIISKEADLTEIYGVCLAENEASLAVMKKCGFVNIFKGTGPYQGVNREIIKNVWRRTFMDKNVKIQDVTIRRENESDVRIVENLVRESFWNVYRPGCSEHFVLHNLRHDPDFVHELDFVMEKNGEVIGQIIFVKTKLKLDDGGEWPIMTMGPICIAPAHQRKGYGKLLLDFGLEEAAKYGCKAVCFEGNIDFYGKSGFYPAYVKNIRYHGMPEGEVADFFLCKELEFGYLDNISGEYATPKSYFVADENPEAFEAFDATFPKKEKRVLPGQIFG